MGVQADGLIEFQVVAVGIAVLARSDPSAEVPNYGQPWVTT